MLGLAIYPSRPTLGGLVTVIRLLLTTKATTSGIDVGLDKSMTDSLFLLDQCSRVPTPAIVELNVEVPGRQLLAREGS